MCWLVKHKVTVQIPCQTSCTQRNMTKYFFGYFLITVFSLNLRKNKLESLSDSYHSCTHPYVHNWSLTTFSQDYDLTSHLWALICIHERRDVQFKVDSGRQIFEKLFHGNFIYSQSFCSEKEILAEEIFSYFRSNI